MKIDQNTLREHVQTYLAANPEIGALLEVRSKDSQPILLNFGHQEETASFPIYSIAKTILALLALDLANQGELNLDAEISKYVHREIPGWLQKATLRNLLSHRSGVFDYGALNIYHQAVRNSAGLAEHPENIIAQVFAKGPQFEPGTSFFYSNVGYMLVREIIESKTGKDLHTLFDTKIGVPLNIQMEVLQKPSKDIMSGFSPYLSKNCPDIRGLYDFAWVFHGTFRACISDLTKLIENLERVIGASAFKEMTSLYPLELPHPIIRPSYGLGLMGDMRASFGPVYGHTGGGPGFSVAAYTCPEKEITVAAVVNRDSSIEAEKLVFESMKLV